MVPGHEIAGVVTGVGRGSPIGGMRKTQEMLDFCGSHNLACDIEAIPIQKVNEAYERLLKSDVKRRTRRVRREMRIIPARSHVPCTPRSGAASRVSACLAVSALNVRYSPCLRVLRGFVMNQFVRD